MFTTFLQLIFVSLSVANLATIDCLTDSHLDVVVVY